MKLGTCEAFQFYFMLCSPTLSLYVFLLLCWPYISQSACLKKQASPNSTTLVTCIHRQCTIKPLRHLVQECLFMSPSVQFLVDHLIVLYVVGCLVLQICHCLWKVFKTHITPPLTLGYTTYPICTCSKLTIVCGLIFVWDAYMYTLVVTLSSGVHTKCTTWSPLVLITALCVRSLS